MSESCTLHMTLDLEYLDFGKCHAFQRVHHKTVTITNHTRVLLYVQIIFISFSGIIN